MSQDSALPDMLESFGKPPEWTKALIKEVVELVEARVCARVAQMLVMHEEKLTEHLGDRLVDLALKVEASAIETRQNSSDLADGVLASVEKTNHLVVALAEGHERIGAAHGHTSTRIREIANGHMSEDRNGGR
jgi:hypothetical protein